jgi:hypothetical protein
MNAGYIIKLGFAAALVAICTILCVGCASYNIPTPHGEARINTFLKNTEIPKIVYAGSNVALTVEGYSGKGDAETVTASAGAIGVIVGAGVKAATGK